MRWITLRQLKTMLRFPVPPEVLEAGRKNLLIAMAETPMAAGVSRFRAYIWKPAMAAFIVVVFVAVSGGGVVFASQGSVPGDALYDVKIASEGFQERLSISPVHSFALEAAHAERRLDETQKLIKRAGLKAQDREARVHKAINGYVECLTSMDKLAGTLAAAPPQRGKDVKAMLAAERVLDRHAELVASATSAGADMIDAVLAPIDASIRLEDDVFTFMHREESDDGGVVEDELVQQRDKRGLKQLRDEHQPKALEIRAGM
jgi:hypothetical protein